MTIGANPLDDNGKPIVGWDAVNNVPAVPEIVNTTVTNGVRHGPASVDVTVSVDPAANQRVNAQSNDFVAGSVTDLATLLTLSGTPSDANTVNSLMGRLTKIRDLLNASLGVQQADLTTTGTISAAQSGINTPVSNATVVLAIGQGQSTWKALLLAGGGGFTSGTTLVADKSVDGGTTWIASSFKVAGALLNTTVQSIVGPGPIELTGNASGVSHIRIRCSVLNSTETIAVTLRAGTGVGDVGLISSIPTGSNLIGGMNLVDSAGTNKAAIDSAGNQAIKGGFAEQASLTAGSLNATLVPSTDVSAYKFWSLHITGVYSGTLTFQGSNNGSTWVSTFAMQLNSTSNYNTTTSATNVIFVGPVQFRYLQIQMTSYSSGTANGVLELYTVPPAQIITDVNVGNFPGNSDGNSIITSAALTTNTNSSDQSNFNNRGVYVYVNTGSFGSGASNIQVTIQGKDPTSGNYYTLLQSVALSASTFYVLQVGPGITPQTNVAIAQSLPRTWRVQATATAWGTGGSTLGVSMGLNL